MNAFQKSQYLKKIYEKCLLRRIHANTFKKMKNKMIDQTFFKIKIIFLNCKFTSKKMKSYRASMKKHLSFIINFVDDKKKSKFNLNMFRKTNMLSLWHSFMKLKKMNLNFRITNQRKLIDDINLANKWFDILSFVESLNNTIRLMIMCINIFDTRTLLKNLKSQVSSYSRRQCTSLK